MRGVVVEIERVVEGGTRSGKKSQNGDDNAPTSCGVVVREIG
jgi:hypothetical protein